MKAVFLVFIFALLVTSWLTDSGAPRGIPIGVNDVSETPTGSDIRDTDAIGDFFITDKGREEQIMTNVRATGQRVGDQPRLGIY